MRIPTTPAGLPLRVDPQTGEALALADAPSVEPYAVDPFPTTLPLALTTTDEFLDDINIDRAVDGTGRARVFYSAPKTKISAALPSIDESQLATFVDFYNNHRGVSFSIQWGDCDAPYALPVIFSRPPSFKHDGNHLTSVTFELVEFP